MRGRAAAPRWTMALGALVAALVIGSLAASAGPAEGRKDRKRKTPAPAASTVPVPSAVPSASVQPSPSGSPVVDASPRPTPMDISSRLTSTLSAINVGTATVTATLYLWDPQSDQRQPLDVTLELGPSDAMSQMVLPGFYSVTFTGVGDADLECTFLLGFTKEILMNLTQEALDNLPAAERDFVIMTSDVLVVDPAFDVTSGADLRVATSPLCLGPEARAELARALAGE